MQIIRVQIKQKGNVSTSDERTSSEISVSELQLTWKPTVPNGDNVRAITCLVIICSLHRITFGNGPNSQLEPKSKNKKNKIGSFGCVLTFTLHLFVFGINFARLFHEIRQRSKARPKNSEYKISLNNMWMHTMHNTNTKLTYALSSQDSCDFCENAGGNDEKHERLVLWCFAKYELNFYVNMVFTVQSQFDTRSTSMEREVRRNADKIYCWFHKFAVLYRRLDKSNNINRPSAPIEILKLQKPSLKWP